MGWDMREGLLGWDAEASRVRMCQGLLQAGTSLAGSISDGVLRSIG